MKNLIIILLLLSVQVTTAQTRYDYGMNTEDYYQGDWSSYSFPGTACTPSFTGEYQIATINDNLPTTNSNWKFWSYSVEAVSFPFIPNACRSQSGERVLTVAGPDDYVVGNKNVWDLSASSEGIIDQLVYRNYVEILGSGQNCNVDNTAADLASILFKSSDFMSLTDPNAQFTIHPHTALKYTFYGDVLDANGQPTNTDNFSYSKVWDHTRGSMNCYPFTSNGSDSNWPKDYDVVMQFRLYHHTTGSSKFILPFCDNRNDYEDLELPLPGPSSWKGYIPEFDIRNSTQKQVAGWDNGDYSTDFGGKKHTYVIDKILDITDLNAEERVIYNPSRVIIDLTDCDGNPRSTTDNRLVFPSCYTFKTVRAKYPDVELDPNSNPTNSQFYYDLMTPENGGPFEDFRDLPFNTDQTAGGNNFQSSIYRIASGSKLELEDGVTIYDATFEVEVGAELIFNSDNVFGRFRIVNLNSAGQPETYSTVRNGRREGPPHWSWEPAGTFIGVKLPGPLELDHNLNDFVVEHGYLCRARTIVAGAWQSGATVTVEDGARARFKAVTRIQLKNGFEAKKGSFFDAEMIPGTWGCLTEYAIGNNPGDPQVPNDEELGTGIADDLENGEMVHVFPNPTKGHLYLESKENLTQIIIKDLSGKEVQDYYPNSSKCTIDVSRLNAGIYIVQCNADNQTIIKKVAVEK